MTTNARKKIDFNQFYGGTDNYYLHPFGGHYTDAVEAMADSYGAYWLIDACMAHGAELYRKLGADSYDCGLLVFTLERNNEGGARLTVDNGNGKTLATQEIEYTDFPEEKFTLWLQNKVLFHPNEY